MQTKKHIINSHIHTTGSDGKLSPEETIKLAIDLGLSYVCFTDHYPYPPGIDSLSEGFHSKEYYEQVLKTIDKFKDKIEISYGAEIGWVPAHKEWIEDEIKKRKYDYLIGSIHHIERTDLNAINDSEDKWLKLIEEYKGIKELVKEYYKQIRLMVNSGLFDCVGHLDIVKIWNKNSKYFREIEDWYKKEVLETLNLLEKSNMCIEINTSGWRKKCNEQYPSFWILLEARKRNIPITIGSDSHNPEEIDHGLEKAIDIAKKAGYNSIMKFKNRKAIEIKI